MLKFIDEYYYVFGLIPVFFYLLFQSRLKVKGIRVIVITLMLGFVADIYSMFLAKNQQPNFFVFNGFILIETLLLLFYFSIIIPTRPIKLTTIISSIAYTVFFIISYILINGNRNYLDSIAAISNIIIIAFCVIYFFKLLNTIENIDFQSNPTFYIVCAYFLYCAGTFFLFLYINRLPKSEQKTDYILNYFFLIPKSLLLCIAMFMKNNLPTRKKFQLT